MAELWIHRKCAREGDEILLPKIFDATQERLCAVCGKSFNEDARKGALYLYDGGEVSESIPDMTYAQEADNIPISPDTPEPAPVKKKKAKKEPEKAPEPVLEAETVEEEPETVEEAVEEILEAVEEVPAEAEEEAQEPLAADNVTETIDEQIAALEAQKKELEE